MSRNIKIGRQIQFNRDENLRALMGIWQKREEDPKVVLK